MSDMRVRAVRQSDWPHLERLIVAMFAELGTTDIPASWAADLRECLSRRLGNDVAAFVAVDDDDTPVAAAVGVIDHRLPSPRRPSGDIGYVEWLVTDPGYRRRGAARAALTELLTWLDARVAVVDVHGSKAARPLYEELRFNPPAAVPLRRR